MYIYIYIYVYIYICMNYLQKKLKKNLMLYIERTHTYRHQGKLQGTLTQWFLFVY